MCETTEKNLNGVIDNNKPYIDYSACVGCGCCKDACPAEAITEKYLDHYVIDLNKCVECGVCVDICQLDAMKRP